ncbi:MAG: type IV toxin-antitoxin system AbiEi family antitoxin domain-containing protein [Propionibacterium sp.]|nr:type IV toxin-antitoxin system AbiEi family antitoxin domain-containing protein [Propionibacterium sp.]
MSTTTFFPSELRRLLDDQASVVTHRQLREAGISGRVIERASRGWARLTRGIYLIGTATWHSAVYAGLLSGAGDGVVGGRAAAYLHGVLRDPPKSVTIWVPTPRHDFYVGEWRVRFRRGHRRGTREPRRSPLEESLLDMASDGHELEIVDAVARALADRRTTPSRLIQALDQRERQRHSKVVREMCDASSSGIESALEWLFLRNVIRRHGLPEPPRQVSTAPGRVDMLYDDANLVVELDGMRDHADWSHDMFRDNDHVLDADRRTMRYGFRAANAQACRAASQIRDALRIHSGAATFQRCRACP